MSEKNENLDIMDITLVLEKRKKHNTPEKPHFTTKQKWK